MNDKATSTKDGTRTTRPVSDKEHLIVVVAVSCSLLVITLAILIFICRRRNRYVKGSQVDSKFPGFVNTSGELLTLLNVSALHFHPAYSQNSDCGARHGTVIQTCFLVSKFQHYI